MAPTFQCIFFVQKLFLKYEDLIFFCWNLLQHFQILTILYTLQEQVFFLIISLLPFLKCGINLRESKPTDISHVIQCTAGRFSVNGKTQLRRWKHTEKRDQNRKINIKCMFESERLKLLCFIFDLNQFLVYTLFIHPKNYISVFSS